ncbi:MAG: Nif3-like dinuclear metal center hexameric protein [Bacteroidota bacterium]
MKIEEVIRYLDNVVPPFLQESYDNSGFMIGDSNAELKGILTCVDVTEDVLEEAKQKSCNLVVSHHPLIFQGMKKLTGQDHVAKTAQKAVKENIAVYAAHTNLDSVDFGVSAILAEKIGLQGTKVLDPRTGILKKLAVFCPEDYAEKVRKAIFEAGAGHIGDYDSCSFNLEGQGSFKAGDEADPFVGQRGELHYEKEVRVETIFPVYRQKQIIEAMIKAHPYEEVAYDIYPLDNQYEKAGFGITGYLETPLPAETFLSELKKKLNLNMLKHTQADGQVSRVAVCGGAGSFLIDKAKAAKVDAFITADLKYHDFFRAENKIILTDIGHYESEKYTKELLNQIISEKFPNFAPSLSEIDTNPVKYL